MNLEKQVYEGRGRFPSKQEGEKNGERRAAHTEFDDDRWCSKKC